MKKILTCVALMGIAPFSMAELVDWEFRGLTNDGKTASGVVSYETNTWHKHTFETRDGEISSRYQGNAEVNAISMVVDGVTYKSIPSFEQSPNLLVQAGGDSDKWEGHFGFAVYTVDSSADDINYTFQLNYYYPNENKSTELPSVAPVFEDLSSPSISVRDDEGLGLFVRITDVQVRPSISVDVSQKTASVGSDGGRLYFERHVENASDFDVPIKQWEYITWPNQINYNRSAPKTVVLPANGETHQSNAYFNVPDYWPAGQYEYHMNAITIQGAKYSTSSFKFTKE